MASTSVLAPVLMQLGESRESANLALSGAEQATFEIIFAPTAAAGANAQLQVLVFNRSVAEQGTRLDGTVINGTDTHHLRLTKIPPLVSIQVSVLLGAGTVTVNQLTEGEALEYTPVVGDFDAGAFTADAAGIAPFADGWLQATPAALAKMADGFLAASAGGLAKMAAGYLQATADGRNKLADNFLSADAVARAKMAANFLTWAHQEALLQTALSSALMDTSVAVPTAGSAKGFVEGTGNECLVEEAAVPDLTVRIQTAGSTYSHLGRPNAVGTVAALAGFTIPAGGGEERRDIVVVAADGTVTRRIGPEGAPTQADATLVAGDVPLARVLLTQGVDTEIQAGNVEDLRERNAVDAAKAIGGSAIPSKWGLTGLKFLRFDGVGAAGPATLTGSLVGERVMFIMGVTTATGAVVIGATPADFEAVITVDDEIQQANVGDLSGNDYFVVLLPAAA